MPEEWEDQFPCPRCGRFLILVTGAENTPVRCPCDGKFKNPPAVLAQSSAATTGKIASFKLTQTMTLASNVNQLEAMQVILKSNVKTGAWAQAIFAQMDYMTDGLAHGSGSVICAELSLPGSSVVRGTYYVWQSEIDCPANCAMNGNPIAVMSVSVWGDNKTQFDDVGLLFDISGVTAGSEKFWDTSASGATGDNTLKIRVGGAFKYILVADDNN